MEADHGDQVADHTVLEEALDAKEVSVDPVAVLDPAAMEALVVPAAMEVSADQMEDLVVKVMGALEEKEALDPVDMDQLEVSDPVDTDLVATDLLEEEEKVDSEEAMEDLAQVDMVALADQAVDMDPEALEDPTVDSDLVVMAA